MQENNELMSIINISASQLSDGLLTPLRKFTGVLDEIIPERDEQFDRIRVRLNFMDVRDVEATEPYTFPVAQLVIPFSSRKRSQWGFLISSIDRLIPNGNINSIQGKTVRMEVRSENFGRWRGETEDRIRDCWVVTQIIDKPSDARQVALKLAVGHSLDKLQPYYQAVLKAPELKTAEGRAVLADILARKSDFIEEALANGELVTDDDGIIRLA